MDAGDIIRLLELARHPEGGWYRETWRDPGPHDPGPDDPNPRDLSSEATGDRRGAGTAIYYLLAAGEVSHWHRVDAAELWHWYAGAPLALGLSPDGRTAKTLLLGPALAEGQRPQHLVPPGHWQSAASLGPWTLCGCTVSPAFSFAGFELAPPGWQPRPGAAQSTGPGAALGAAPAPQGRAP
jgi:predicted cupin superfamily sugar epimerase